MEADLPDFKKIAVTARKRKQCLIAFAFVVIVLLVCLSVSAFFFLLPALEDQTTLSEDYKKDSATQIINNDKLTDDVVAQEPLGPEVSRKRRGIFGRRYSPRIWGNLQTEPPQTQPTTVPFETTTFEDTLPCQIIGQDGISGDVTCRRRFTITCPPGFDGQRGGENGRDGQDGQLGRDGVDGPPGSNFLPGQPGRDGNNGAPDGVTCDTDPRDVGQPGRPGGVFEGCDRNPQIICDGQAGAPGREAGAPGQGEEASALEQPGSDRRTGAPGQPGRGPTGTTFGPKGPGRQSGGSRNLY